MLSDCSQKQWPTCADNTFVLPQLCARPRCHEAHAELHCPHLRNERSWSGDCQKRDPGRSSKCNRARSRSCRMARPVLPGVYKNTQIMFHAWRNYFIGPDYQVSYTWSENHIPKSSVTVMTHLWCCHPKVPQPPPPLLTMA